MRLLPIAVARRPPSRGAFAGFPRAVAACSGAASAGASAASPRALARPFPDLAGARVAAARLATH